jgi:heme exporter protein C
MTSTPTRPSPAGERIPLDPLRPSRWSTPLGWAALMLVGATCGLGLALPRSKEQAEYSRLLAIHPGLAWASYFGVGLAALFGALYLARRSPRFDRANGASTEVAAVFTALALATGSLWGRPTWGVWWQWDDPRLLTSALLMALLLGALALRRSLVPGQARGVVSAVFSLVALALLPIVHFSVTLWRSQHQIGTLASPAPEENADGIFLLAMFVGFLAFTVLAVWLVLWRARVEALEESADDVLLAAAIADRRAEGAGARR